MTNLKVRYKGPPSGGDQRSVLHSRSMVKQAGDTSDSMLQANGFGSFAESKELESAFLSRIKRLIADTHFDKLNVRLWSGRRQDDD